MALLPELTQQGLERREGVRQQCRMLSETLQERKPTYTQGQIQTDTQLNEQLKALI
jgi:hypothetical protein